MVNSIAAACLRVLKAEFWKLLLNFMSQWLRLLMGCECERQEVTDYYRYQGIR